MNPAKLSTVGIHEPERQALERYLEELLALLSSEHATLPSRQHPVVDRLLVSYEGTDPVNQLEQRLSSDPEVLNSLRGRLARTRNRLHRDSVLGSGESTDLAVSLVAVRIYLSWKAGMLGSSDLEVSFRKKVAEADKAHAAALRAWLWSGLVLSRLSGEGEDEDLDFGM